MKTFKQILISNQTQMLLVLFILLVGIGIRVYRPQNYEFGFDQIQILQKAEEISHGDFSLVGPRTGPADLFTGPLVYYVTAIFLIFSQNSPYSLVGLVFSISFLSGTSLYFLAKRSTDFTTALSILAIWACGPLFIQLDRFAWNPLLSLPASALVFFTVLHIIKKNTWSWLDMSFIFLGSFLGYQAHFSCLILPFLVFTEFLVLKRQYVWMSVVSVLGLLISIIPTILFDLRQDWHNTRGLFSLLFNKDKVETKFDFFRFFADIRISFENIGKVFFSGTNGVLLVTFGIFIVLISLLLIKKHVEVRQSVLLSLIWIATITICFSFYRQSKPEYYFLVQFPAIFLLILEVLNQYISKRVQQVLILFFCIYGFLFVLGSEMKVNGFGLGVQYQVAQEIQSRIDGGNIGSVHYGMKQIEAEGIKYFLRKQNSSLTSVGEKLFVLYPVNEGRTIDTRLGAVGIWQDTRTDVSKNYLTLEDYILVTPQNISLLKDDYLSPNYDGNTVYRIVKDGVLTQNIVITISRKEYLKDLFQRIQNEVQDKPWQEISIDQYQGKTAYFPEKDLLFVYMGNDESTPILSGLFEVK